MAEILVMRIDRNKCKAGDVVDIQEDGHTWSKAELAETGFFRLVKIPGVPKAKLKGFEEHVYNASDLLSLDPYTRANPRIEKAVRYKLDLTKVDAVEADLQNTLIASATREEELKETIYDQALEKYVVTKER